MKIKKVSIQAFKSYLYKKDGTFDFMLDSQNGNNSEPADFISLYAPNGFGKTSFYDAIDYAITNNVNRYLRGKRLTDENKKQGKHHNKQGKKQYILRNRDADSEPNDLKTRVVVETTKHSYTSTYKKFNTGYMDYRFDLADSRPNSNYFSEVLLTQEAIDAFLREISSEERFDKFAENTTKELKEYNQQRLSLVCVCRDTENKKQVIEKEKATLETGLKSIEKEDNPFQVANDVIQKLSLAKLAFTDFLNPFTSAHQSSVKDKIEFYKSQLEKNSQARKQEINTLEGLLNDLSSSQRKLEGVRESEIKLNQVTSAISSHKSKFLLESKVTQINAHIHEQQVNVLDGFIGQLPAFIKYQKVLTELSTKANQCKKNINEIKQEKIANENLLDKLRLQQSSSVGELQEVNDLQLTSEHIFVKIVELENEIKALNERLLKLTSEQLSNESDVSDTKNKIQLIQSFDIRSLIVEVENESEKELNKLHQQYIAASDKHQLLQEELADIEKKLGGVKEQSQAVSSLIKQASEIIADSQQSECPLCQHQYDDFLSLQHQITTNPALGSIEKGLTEQHQLNLGRLKMQEDVIDGLRARYRSHCKNFLSGQQVKEQEATAVVHAKGSKINSLREAVSDKGKCLKLFKEKTLYKSVSELKSYLTDVENILKSSLADVKKQIEVAESSQQKSLLKLPIVEKDLLKIESEKNKHELKSVEYQKFMEFLEQNGQQLDAEFKELEQYLNSSKARVQKKNNEFKEQQQEIKKNVNEIEETIHQDLKGLSAEQLQLKQLGKEKEISQLKQLLSEFNTALKLFELKTPEIAEEWVEFRDIAQLKLDEIDRKAQLDQESMADLELLELFAARAVNYCNRQDLQAQLDDKQNAIDKHIKICKTLSDDLDKVNRYIEKAVNLYFKTDLINQIYSSIDPHPDYKKIRFECKIGTDNKAELKISAVNPDNNDVVSPNLQFSSAQINVLSLSVFLARALTATDDEGHPVNCIFIDDPIQSMDSINVLSLIDLFRNFSVRFGKQLIISTHDENFHELLKKKIPPNIFKAKYLSLASFGKVVEDPV